MKNRVYKKNYKPLTTEQKIRMNELFKESLEYDKKLRHLTEDENHYLQSMLKKHMNSASYVCKLKKMNPYKSVERDNDVSFVEVTPFKQSLIKKIRYTKKIKNYPKRFTAYQFINTFYCDKCNDYHVSDLVQIEDDTFKKHCKENQIKVRNALKPSERRMKNVKIKSLNKKSLTASEKSLIADFKSKQL